VGRAGHAMQSQGVLFRETRYHPLFWLQHPNMQCTPLTFNKFVGERALITSREWIFGAKKIIKRLFLMFLESKKYTLNSWKYFLNKYPRLTVLKVVSLHYFKQKVRHYCNEPLKWSLICEICVLSCRSEL
jgi:hypothetical protein